MDPEETMAVVESQQPILVWTNLKNLKHIHSAKRLNTQTRWALLFTIFNFSIAYCPGTRNIKPNASMDFLLVCPFHKVTLLSWL